MCNNGTVGRRRTVTAEELTIVLNHPSCCCPSWLWVRLLAPPRRVLHYHSARSNGSGYGPFTECFATCPQQNPIKVLDLTFTCGCFAQSCGPVSGGLLSISLGFPFSDSLNAECRSASDPDKDGDKCISCTAFHNDMTSLFHFR